MPEIVIDGERVEFKDGETILDVAWRIGKEIPVLCYHPHLPTFAGCRICLVEVEEKGRRRMVPSCATKAREGMVVYTDTPKIRKYVRRSVLALLLANHPIECPMCDRGGECDLQNLVFLWGPEKASYTFEKEKKSRISAPPFLELYPNRCVLCNRCVSFYREVAGDGDWGLYFRGNKAYVGPLDTKLLESEFSGNLVEICPLGAITDRYYRFRARPWELKMVKSISFHDSLGVNLNLYIRKASPYGRGPIKRGGEREELHEIVRVHSRFNPDINFPWIDDRSRYAHDFINGKNRLTAYLYRDKKSQIEIDRERAIQIFFDRINDIVLRYGSSSVALLSRGRGTNESAFLFSKLLRRYLGTNNLDSRSPQGGVGDPLIEYWGVSASRGSVTDIKNSTLILVFHPSIRGSVPSLALHLRTAMKMGREIIYFGYSEDGGEKRWAKKIFLVKPCELYDILKEAIETLEGNGKSELGFLIRNSSNPLFIFSEDLHPGIKELILKLTIIKEDSVFLVVREGPNTQGFIDMGIHPELLPGQILSPLSGFGSKEVFDKMEEGEVKALILWNVDPLNEYPEREKILKAIKKLDFLVVFDFLRTEVMDHANLVVPVATPHEEEGSYTNLEGRVQFFERALTSPSGISPVYEFISDVLNLYGDIEYPKKPEEIFDLIKREIPLYSQIEYGRFELEEKNYPDFLSSLSLIKRGYRYSKVRYNFTPRKRTPHHPKPDDGEFILVGLPHIYGDRYSLNSSLMDGVVRSEEVEVSSIDAEKLGIKDGDRIYLVSDGKRSECRVKISAGLREGILRIWGPVYGSGLNSLLSNCGFSPVKLEKIG